MADNTIRPTGTYVTAKGYKLLAKLLAVKGQLTYTRAAVGIGQTPDSISPESLIGLNAYKMDAEIADYNIEDDKAYVTVQVSSEHVTEGFLATEVGVFAQDPDDGEILYGYMDISGDPTYIYGNTSTAMAKFAEFQLYFLIGQIKQVTASITPRAYISHEVLAKALAKKIDAESGEIGNAVTTFDDSGSMSEITSFSAMLQRMVTGSKLAVTLRNLKAGLQYVLHVGSIVNNCVSDNPNLPLSAAQGKVLQDQISVLNAKTNEIGLDPKTTYEDIKALNLYNGKPVTINGVVNGISWAHGIVLFVSPWKKATFLLTDDDADATFLLHLRGSQTLDTATYKNL